MLAIYPVLLGVSYSSDHAKEVIQRDYDFIVRGTQLRAEAQHAHGNCAGIAAQEDDFLICLRRPQVHSTLAGVTVISMIITYPAGLPHVQELVSGNPKLLCYTHITASRPPPDHSTCHSTAFNIALVLCLWIAGALGIQV
jgi:hypothetical protein